MKNILTSLTIVLALVSGNAVAQDSALQKQTTNQVTEKRPLIILADGTENYKLERTAIKDITPDWIDAVEVLKDAKATEKFGDAGRDGVVIITLKKDVEAANLFLENLKKNNKK
ncbi:hypothetical protein [Pontibacter fetidus]|uniref:TonB-dependent receptor plug domain-containing protein n=1 Tax=Pontibacter fetidus TaxID=2700082 RepID=A0A6B2H7M2_9BACT|nr:hypothetical protein [Pontibacter fetidus]NDK55104.1 hypothetical protein [Pontibacter fetidus]